MLSTPVFIILAYIVAILVFHFSLRFIVGSELDSAIVIMLIVLIMTVSIGIGIGVRNQQLYPMLGIDRISRHEVKVDNNVVSNWVEIVWKDGRREIKDGNRY